jgi:tRNA(fMet)-specific endonuclease VapC
MIYVLDTTVVSALMRAEPAPSARLLREPRENVEVPQPVHAELLYGIARLPSSRRRRELEAALAVLLRDLVRSTWTDEVSQSFAEVKAGLDGRGERIEDFDIAVAAHALAVGGTVVTRNLRHFARIRGLALQDWA